jgi:hypothetical protein
VSGDGLGVDELAELHRDRSYFQIDPVTTKSCFD